MIPTELNIIASNHEETRKQQRHQLPFVRLRIHELGHANNYRSVSAIHRKLISLGGKTSDVSHSKLLRIANNTAGSLDVDVLSALAYIFNCSIKDLFEDGR